MSLLLTVASGLKLLFQRTSRPGIRRRVAWIPRVGDRGKDEARQKPETGYAGGTPGAGRPGWNERRSADGGLGIVGRGVLAGPAVRGTSAAQESGICGSGDFDVSVGNRRERRNFQRGVVPDLDDQDLIPSATMTIYQPSEVEGWYGQRLFVRAKNDPYALVPSITREIHEIAADQPVEHASTLDDIRAEVITPDRLNAVVFGGFASLALLISVVGVAGVLAFSASGRIREFGFRLALGASPRHVLTDVLLEGSVIAGIGVAAGVLTGFLSMQAIAKYTADFQVPGALPLLASAALILAAALIASALPAVRASRVDAVQALRSE